VYRHCRIHRRLYNLESNHLCRHYARHNVWYYRLTPSVNVIQAVDVHGLRNFVVDQAAVVQWLQWLLRRGVAATSRDHGLSLSRSHDVIRRIVWRLIPCHYRTIVRLIGPAGQVISMTSSSHNGLWKADLTGPKIDLEHYVSLTCNVLRFCIWCTHWGLCQSQCHRPQGNTLLHLQLLRSSVPTPHFSRKCSGAHNHMFGGSKLTHSFMCVCLAVCSCSYDKYAIFM